METKLASGMTGLEGSGEYSRLDEKVDKETA